MQKPGFKTSVERPLTRAEVDDDLFTAIKEPIIAEMRQIRERIGQLKYDPEKAVEAYNIMIFGPTGAGKSSFIKRAQKDAVQRLQGQRAAGGGDLARPGRQGHAGERGDHEAHLLQAAGGVPEPDAGWLAHLQARSSGRAPLRYAWPDPHEPGRRSGDGDYDCGALIRAK